MNHSLSLINECVIFCKIARFYWLYNQGILTMSSMNNKSIVWSYNFRPDGLPDNHNIRSKLETEPKFGFVSALF